MQLRQVDWILDRPFERSFPVSIRFFIDRIFKWHMKVCDSGRRKLNVHCPYLLVVTLRKKYMSFLLGQNCLLNAGVCRPGFHCNLLHSTICYCMARVNIITLNLTDIRQSREWVNEAHPCFVILIKKNSHAWWLFFWDSTLNWK